MLVLQDLGKWMEPLESWMYPPTTSAAASPHSLETCGSVGARLGGILASIHCDATLLIESRRLTGDGKPWFENPDTEDIVRDRILGRILPIHRPRVAPDTGKLKKFAEIIPQDFERGFYNTLLPLSSPSLSFPKPIFSMGDLWTGSILVGTPPPAGSNPNPISSDGTEVEVGLIDWEFAHPARIGQDISQLSAWLYLFSTSSSWSSIESRHHHAVVDTTAISPASSVDLGRFGPDFGTGVSYGPGAEGGAEPVTGETLGLRSAAGSLLDALLEAYARKMREYPDYAWFVDEDYDRRRFRKERLTVIRSIWVSFGREVIYMSVDAESMFTRFFVVGVDGGEREGERLKVWQRAMVEVGSWYISRAGECPDEEFEDVVRKEGVLRRMYTRASGAP